ncbi:MULTISPECIES: ParB/RepB/Spo0J family partition protein [unclassified Streptomyces]|uniref:ParB/RepB/Spo0J family partition protein n=1 Tax=unclassified Streptomyces TaxID=2593676 RepID=UPI0006992B00|nr:ParB/RepB/Spo0J family partition protein [Streptomyces sp. CNQ-509]
MLINQIVRAERAGGSDTLLALREAVRDLPVEKVPVASLVVTFSPRAAGVDAGYALALSEVEAELPPILVHRGRMAVIDGRHRLRAARLNGAAYIGTRFFDGSESDARLLAVAMNVAQGLPLSRGDRIASALRILTARPQWSDRSVAAVAGLSARTVAELRGRARGQAHDAPRIGLDGRRRPFRSAQGRELAAKLLGEEPGASLRSVARRAGISPATVADVRDRLRRGDDPVPLGQREEPAAERPAREPAPPPVPALSPGELFVIFDSLCRDPSLRMTETGRTVLRMLDACHLIARDREKITVNLPPHCREQLAELLRGYAGLWRDLAGELGAGRAAGAVGAVR